MREARKRIAEQAAEFADSVSLPGRRTPVETLPMEIMPLLDALKFLERSAGRLLAVRHLGRAARPVWLTGVVAELHREPFGVVLVIAPFNYPLFLPGVQVLQALAAGNAVLVKPSPGHSAPMTLLRKTLIASGLPETLLTVLGESIDAAQEAMAQGVNKVILTGSATSGRAVLAEAAKTLTPAILELSGNDAVFVLPGGDLDRVARALAYGVRLNGGATCIAPRRVFITEGQSSGLRQRLVTLLKDSPPCPVTPATLAQLQALLPSLGDGQIEGGQLAPDGKSITPAIVFRPARDAALLTADIFAPVLSIVPVADMSEALVRAAECPFSLGAAVFGLPADARRFAARVDTGVVVINDLIVPTADPRIPFEARRESGFGATRGGDGLLAMTQAKTVMVRKNRSERHMQPVTIDQAEFFLRFIDFVYGGGRLPKRFLKGMQMAAAALRMR